MILCILMAFLSSKNELSHSTEWCVYIPQLPAEIVVFIFSWKEKAGFVTQLEVMAIKSHAGSYLSISKWISDILFMLLEIYLYCIMKCSAGISGLNHLIFLTNQQSSANAGMTTLVFSEQSFTG